MTTLSLTHRRLRPRARRLARRAGFPPRKLWPYTLPGAAAFYERRWGRMLRTTAVIGREEHLRRTGVSEIEEGLACTLCGEADLQPLFRPFDRRRGRWVYHVVRCPSCGFLYRNPGIRPERLGDLYAGQGYGRFLTGRYGRNRQLRYRISMDRFDPLFADGRGRRLLDFGCGAGLFLEVAHERSFDCYGVDLSCNAVERAHKRPGGANAHFGRPEDVPEIAQGGFDLITLWSVLAHLPRPSEEIGKLRRLLAPDGALVILTVNANSLLLKARHEGWNGFTPNHLVFFSQETLARMLRALGFEALVVRPFYSDALERGVVRLRHGYERRLRRNVERGNQGNMLRVAAFRSASGPERWGLADAVAL
jgi:2-polyprenyl-3-methyl-5-hydroxy-6-metoxy-1,4-benzoquinol methylase